MILEQLTTFFGWMSVLNIAFLLVAAIGLSLLRPVAVRLHSSLFSLSEEALNRAYCNYLANLKRFQLLLDHSNNWKRSPSLHDARRFHITLIQRNMETL